VFVVTEGSSVSGLHEKAKYDDWQWQMDSISELCSDFFEAVNFLVIFSP
jgi:hypothetical protein